MKKPPQLWVHWFVAACVAAAWLYPSRDSPNRTVFTSSDIEYNWYLAVAYAVTVATAVVIFER